MRIQWNRVTWYSQLVAIVLFVGVFGVGIYLGMHIEKNILLASTAVQK